MFVQGFLLIDVDGAALNNTGVVSRSGVENTVETKKIYKEGGCYPYASGEAWGNWWRTSLGKNTGWKLSPVTYDQGNKIAFTAADPFKYEDDDIFGYMKAIPGEGNEPLTRISPLKTSIIGSVCNVRVAKNFCVMARQNDVPAPYGKEEYSAVMKGMFSLDIEQVGTFSKYYRAGYKNITEAMFEQHEQECTVIEDKFTLAKDGGKEKLIRIDDETRLKRITDTIKALKYISGGAMQTNNMVDVTPKFIVLAKTKYGNHPFSHIVFADPIRKEQSIFDVAKFVNTINDNAELFDGDIYIGRRDGFWEEYDELLKTLDTASNCSNEDVSINSNDRNNEENESNGDNKPIVNIHYGPVNKMINEFCSSIKLDDDEIL